MTDDDLDFRTRLNELPFDDSSRQDHREQLRERVLATFDQSQTDPSPRPVPRPSSNWRQFMRRPVPRIAAAALVAASLFGVYFSLVGTHSAAAFDRIAEPILKAKTARFTVVIEGKDLPKQTTQALVLEPDRFRQELPNGQVQIIDGAAGKMMLLTPVEKRALLYNLTDVPKHQKPANFFAQLRTHLRAATDDPSSKKASLGAKQIDGQETVGFRLKTPDHETTMWGDPKTHRPVLVVITFAQLPGTKVTLTHFEFDVALDEALFAVNPPDGYTVQHVQVSGAAPAEQDLIATLKLLRDHNQGRFPDTFDNGAILSLLTDWAARNKPGQPEVVPMNKITELSIALRRGIAFAVTLPAESKARYAGKGIKRDDKTAAVFWYRPAGTSKYRVIHADLSVSVQPTAPESPGAVPVNAGPSITDRLRKILNDPPQPVAPLQPQAPQAAPPARPAPPPAAIDGRPGN
jgi:outer membrane lipoprotein-sorting protein